MSATSPVPAGTTSSPQALHGQRKEAWPQRAIIAGFMATAAATVVLAAAYGAALTAGQQSSSNVFVQWLYNLAHNAVTNKAADNLYAALMVQLVIGLLFAVVYAYVAEPILRGAPWMRGLLFALVPFILSVVVFFPVAGAGFLGSGVNAGPLPVLGNLVLHVIYGVTLGQAYVLNSVGGADSNGRDIGANNHAERGAAFGIVLGAIIGGVGGMLVGIFSRQSPGDIMTGPWQTFLFGSVLGAVAGALIGSMSGLTQVFKHGDERDR